MPNSKIDAIALCSDKCTGCTNCIRVCPTEAIRVKNRKAMIIKKRCINCGQCVNVCPHNALYGLTDDFSDVENYQFPIALVDPVFYGQFNENHLDPQLILEKIKALGFSLVWETSISSPIITEFTRKHLEKSEQFPVISSSCPAIIRTIQIRFPDLISNILPMDSPVEIAADMAIEHAQNTLKVPREKIGVFYISTCPARSYSFKNPVGRDESNIDGTLSIKDIFLKISSMDSASKPENDYNPEFYPNGSAIGWARLGGQAQALSIKDFLAVDGIENVIDILEEVEDDKLENLRFLECQACKNGCVGGNFCVENSFVARNRIRILTEKYQNYSTESTHEILDRYLIQNPIEPFSVSSLDHDLSKALGKMEEINEVFSSLPDIDCGACGSPSCRALAEDIVMGYASLKDCIVLLKENDKDEENNSEE